jgi:glycosyltransferase involved in cell wall biosynthesis
VTSLAAIHQLTPRLSVGDAVSNHVLWIRDCLRRLGYASEIYTESAVPALEGEVRLLIDAAIPGQAGLIYHHCIGTSLTDLVAAHAGPKTLIYHNITPPEFFAPYNAALAEVLRVGREGLPALAGDYRFAYGDSLYNVSELRGAGFSDCRVMPLPVTPLEAEPDKRMLAALDDGLANLLFVGRVAPNKAQHDLVESFYHYLCMDDAARLIIGGVADPSDRYVEAVKGRIDKLGLQARVILTGHVSDAELSALYRRASLFWSMSEHEGFGVPLIEAMWWDVPVLAYKSSAVAETMGEGGIIFDDKSDLRRVAALAKLMVRDDELRAKVLAAQRRRRRDFLPELILPQVKALAETLVGGP